MQDRLKKLSELVRYTKALETAARAALRKEAHRLAGIEERIRELKDDGAGSAADMPPAARAAWARLREHRLAELEEERRRVRLAVDHARAELRIAIGRHEGCARFHATLRAEHESRRRARLAEEGSSGM